jgi:hypothetical protein
LTENSLRLLIVTLTLFLLMSLLTGVASFPIATSRRCFQFPELGVFSAIMISLITGHRPVDHQPREPRRPAAVWSSRKRR